MAIRLARRLPTIVPPMTLAQALEVSGIRVGIRRALDPGVPPIRGHRTAPGAWGLTPEERAVHRGHPDAARTAHALRRLRERGVQRAGHGLAPVIHVDEHALATHPLPKRPGDVGRVVVIRQDDLDLGVGKHAGELSDKAVFHGPRDALEPGMKRLVVRGAEVLRERKHIRPAKIIGANRQREEGGVCREAAKTSETWRSSVSVVVPEQARSSNWRTMQASCKRA